jgi:hypothetical protein
MVPRLFLLIHLGAGKNVLSSTSHILRHKQKILLSGTAKDGQNTPRAGPKEKLKS